MFMMPEALKSLPEFIRLRVCIYVVFIALSGHLLFNALSGAAILVVLASFFACASAYAHNNLTDFREDRINRGKVNSFVSRRWAGYSITAACAVAGAAFVFQLHPLSLLFYFSGLLGSALYSTFRLKKYFLFKNLYTGFVANQIFLMGAFTAGPAGIAASVFSYYLVSCFLVFILSMISDLRDYRGDRAAGLKTLPVLLGYERCRKLVAALAALFLVSTAFFGRFLILMPFSALVLLAVLRNRPSLAHAIGGNSFILLASWLVL